MTFRRGIQDQSEAWAKLYDKKEKEAMKVANPKETLRKMYDKLVTPKLQRHGASAPLPFEDESSRGNVTSSKEENAKKKAKKGDGKSASKKERERAKKKKKKKKSKKAQQFLHVAAGNSTAAIDQTKALALLAPQAPRHQINSKIYYLIYN
ncbi:unnamed protein product [Durusdinium trenchii]|uniref:Uncharacterized protein n=1 Tax=Durusdinium trenchii TaxID=1381693 RepID=A0ABP0JJJ3_9DINO